MDTGEVCGMRTRRLARTVAALAMGALCVAGAGLSAAGAQAANNVCTPGTSTIAQCFPDPNLATVVASAMGKTSGQTLTQADITKTTRISNYGNKISSLQGIQILTNLSEVSLPINNISDISPLATLTGLTMINLASNKLSDLSVLRAFTKLSYLDLGKNQITDISPLSGLTNLTFLFIPDNQISDISPLKGLTTLTFLTAYDNQIRDISPLRNLTKLKSLMLHSNRISDISPLRNLTRLYDLHLNDNQIRDVSPLSGLTNLDTLRLANNQIRDISPLSGLANVSLASLNGQKITLPAVSGPTVTVGSARTTDGTPVTPDALNPASGVYNPAAGSATWSNLTGSGEITLHTATKATVGWATNLPFDVTIVQPYTVPATVKVTADPQNGQRPTVYTLTPGDILTLNGTPTRAGYTLSGWNTKADATGTSFDFTKPVTADATIYAQWRQNPAPTPTPDNHGGNTNPAALPATGSNLTWPTIAALILTAATLAIFLARRQHNQPPTN